MTYLMQVGFPYFTGLPEDLSINTFHFNWLNPGDPGTTDYTNLCNDVILMYNAIFGVVGQQLMAGVINPAAVFQKVYNLTDPEPRPPRFMITGSGVLTDPLFDTPLEVSLCLSYEGAKVAGLQQASRRGRIYLGPLGDIVTTVHGDPTHFPVPGTVWTTNILAAAHQLTVATIGHGWQWVVYSRKLGSSTPVVDGWVDNAWDTQRRRGNAATSRRTWTAFLP